MANIPKEPLNQTIWFFDNCIKQYVIDEKTDLETKFWVISCYFKEMMTMNVVLVEFSV
jgi:hypothetical protein